MKYLFSALCFVLVLPVFVFAQNANPAREGGNANPIREGSNANPNIIAPIGPGSTQIENPLDPNISTIPAFFAAIIDILLIFAVPLVVFFIIWAGFLYVTARGNAEKIKQAHAALLYAVIGGLLILGANLLLDVITNTVDQVRG